MIWTFRSLRRKQSWSPNFSWLTTAWYIRYNLAEFVIWLEPAECVILRSCGRLDTVGIMVIKNIFHNMIRCFIVSRFWSWYCKQIWNTMNVIWGNAFQLYSYRDVSIFPWYFIQSLVTIYRIYRAVWGYIWIHRVITYSRRFPVKQFKFADWWKMKFDIVEVKLLKKHYGEEMKWLNFVIHWSVH